MKKIAEIEELRKIADRFAACILVNDKAGASELLPELASWLERVIVLVMGYCDRPEMSALADDRGYLPEQLKRILGAIEKQDGFLIYDSLENELMMNLDYFAAQADKAGVL